MYIADMDEMARGQRRQLFAPERGVAGQAGQQDDGQHRSSVPDGPAAAGRRQGAAVTCGNTRPGRHNAAARINLRPSKEFSVPKTMQCLSWLSASLLAATAAHAQDADDVRLGSAIREGGRVGLAVIASHAYKGSDESRTSALPALEYRWANGWFAGVGSGVGYEFLRSEGTTAAVRLTPDFGRKESRSAALAGMGDIERTAEIGGYINHAVQGLGLGLNASMQVGRNGASADIGAAYGLPLAPALRLRLGVAATLANARYMQTHFGVDATQSVNSGYAPYEAGAGVRDARLSASMLYLLAPKWVLTGSLTQSTLLGDAADSPLTRQRSALTAVATVSYGF
jgi:MipA family protein